SRDRPGRHTLGFEAVCDRLIESGLPSTFAGAIKFWNCNSGYAGIDIEGNRHTPFAKRCADYLREQGYLSCHFFGYEAELNAEPLKKDIFNIDGLPDTFERHDYHKRARVKKENCNLFTFNKFTYKRAKDKRVKF